MVSLVNVNNTVFIHLLDSSLVYLYLYDSHDTPTGWFTLVYHYNLNWGANTFCCRCHVSVYPLLVALSSGKPKKTNRLPMKREDAKEALRGVPRLPFETPTLQRSRLASGGIPPSWHLPQHDGQAPVAPLKASTGALGNRLYLSLS